MSSSLFYEMGIDAEYLLVDYTGGAKTLSVAITLATIDRVS